MKVIFPEGQWVYINVNSLAHRKNDFHFLNDIFEYIAYIGNIGITTENV